MKLFTLLMMVAVAAIGMWGGYRMITGRDLIAPDSFTFTYIGRPELSEPGVQQDAVPRAPAAEPQETAAPAIVPVGPTAAAAAAIPLLPAAVPAAPTAVPASPGSTPARVVGPTAGATATPAAAAAPSFRSWWVQSDRETQLWSGVDDRAISFGPVPRGSYFMVVEPQQGPRLHVLNPVTQNYAYIDASAVGSSTPPPPGVAGRGE